MFEISNTNFIGLFIVWKKYKRTTKKYKEDNINLKDSSLMGFLLERVKSHLKSGNLIIRPIDSIHIILLLITIYFDNIFLNVNDCC